MKETATTVVRSCELCNGEAAVCCPSDSAFLCWSCDAKVHDANFLVARHIRNIICLKCKSFTGHRVSGFGVAPIAGHCGSCSSPPPPEEEEADLGDAVSSSSSSSACVSSTHSLGQKKMSDQSSESFPSRNEFSSEVTFPATGLKCKARSAPVPAKVDPAAEGIFVNWCKRLGIGAEDKVVRKACDAFRLSTALISVLPFRAVLAASLWFSLRRCRGHSESTWRAVKKLEEISGVPAKLILAAESKLHRVEKAERDQSTQLKIRWLGMAQVGVVETDNLMDTNGCTDTEIEGHIFPKVSLDFSKSPTQTIHGNHRLGISNPDRRVQRALDSVPQVAVHCGVLELRGVADECVEVGFERGDDIGVVQEEFSRFDRFPVPSARTIRAPPAKLKSHRRYRETHEKMIAFDTTILFCIPKTGRNLHQKPKGSKENERISLPGRSIPRKRVFERGYFSRRLDFFEVLSEISAGPAEVDPAAEGIFVNLVKRLGNRRGGPKLFRKAFATLFGSLRSDIGFTVSEAASRGPSLWIQLRRCQWPLRVHVGELVKKLEEISGRAGEAHFKPPSRSCTGVEKAGKPRRIGWREGWDSHEVSAWSSELERWLLGHELRDYNIIGRHLNLKGNGRRFQRALDSCASGRGSLWCFGNSGVLQMSGVEVGFREGDDIGVVQEEFSRTGFASKAQKDFFFDPDRFDFSAGIQIKKIYNWELPGHDWELKMGEGERKSLAWLEMMESSLFGNHLVKRWKGSSQSSDYQNT
nr:B-box zinc finger protein 32-like [Ipomoea batatas]